MLHEQTEEKDEMLKSELILRHQLKKMLKEHDLSATALARRCGIAKQVISDWLAGAKPKHIEKVKVIADFFNMSMDELCFGCSKYKRVNVEPSPEKDAGFLEQGHFEVIIKKMK